MFVSNRNSSIFLYVESFHHIFILSFQIFLDLVHDVSNLPLIGTLYAVEAPNKLNKRILRFHSHH